ncbi:hypothetical protein J1N35_041131 [Gossypium stocksii]|uniref:Uncharacterized protein n=1 Tax=Gossypium stocksii TaxID=47602 RepID=A0A9D3ZJ41_9ROSI|nr:hypothetical protein J1N35_041131 [Gossypium stocksii]
MKYEVARVRLRAYHEEEEIIPVHARRLLVVKRSLSIQTLENDQQWENIFHSLCQVQGKVCSLIIDSGSYTNVASTLMVERLGLPTTKHSSPYKLQRLNDGGKIKVSKDMINKFHLLYLSKERRFTLVGKGNILNDPSPLMSKGKQGEVSISFKQPYSIHSKDIAHDVGFGKELYLDVVNCLIDVDVVDFIDGKENFANENCCVDQYVDEVILNHHEYILNLCSKRLLCKVLS